METVKPLVDKEYQLQKSWEGKGSWTFVEIPEIPMAKRPFGMLRVRGMIDDYEFSKAHLMPMGNGNLGLPVKAQIRKRIRKEAPDTVHITLYEDKAADVIPEDLILCMERDVLTKFESYSDAQKKVFADWIESAKTEQTKIDRITKTIAMIENGKKI